MNGVTQRKNNSQKGWDKMSIFGPTDTRNYKKLANEIYDIEVRFANSFCEMYAVLHNSTKFAVMDAARPYGGLVYLYGALLAYQVLKENNATNEESILIYYFAKVHKKPEAAFGGTLEENTDVFKTGALAEIERGLYGMNFPTSEGTAMFEKFFEQVEAVVNKWSRDEF